MTRAKHLRTPSLRVLMGRLRKKAPLQAPVRLVQQKNCVCGGYLVLGYAAARYRYPAKKPVAFRITVDPRLSIGERWEVVIHEWAHCLDRATGRRPSDCHDARWGQHYAKAFRASLPS